MDNFDINAVAGRLKQDIARQESKAEAAGFNEGRLWTQHACPHEVRKLAETSIEFYPQSHSDLNFAGLWEFLSSHYDALYNDREADDDPSTWFEGEQHAWAVGFVKGVAAVWQHVQDKR